MIVVIQRIMITVGAVMIILMIMTISKIMTMISCCAWVVANTVSSTEARVSRALITERVLILPLFMIFYI